METTGSSFAKGLAVLGCLLDRDRVRADEIADGLGMPLSSTYRYLRTLRQGGFAAEIGGTYVAGPRLRGHVGGVTTRVLGELAAPFLDHLVEVTTETAVLTVRRGRHAICIGQAESSHRIHLAFRVGQLLPLYAGAGQRVLLAFAPDHVVRDVLDNELRTFTAETPSRREVLRTLGRIKEAGYAVSRGEIMTGAIAIGVPVLHGQSALCALTVAGPRDRCPASWREHARRELTAAASSLAELLVPQA
jgi:DNA-binding IclR family transcriptional regulator